MLLLSAPHRHTPGTTARALNAAWGYLELNMVREARRELESLSFLEQTGPIALCFRVRLNLYENRWETAERVARNAAAMFPEEHELLVQRIFALYQLNRTKDARKLLRRSPAWLHNSGLLHYDLACYEALIGDPATAHECAKAAFILRPTLKRFARRDPDLRSVLGDTCPIPESNPGCVSAGDNQRTAGA